MRIGNTGGVGTNQIRRSDRRKKTDSAFTLGNAVQSGAAAAGGASADVAGSGAVAPVGTLLNVQEVGQETTPDDSEHDRAERMLKLLDDLRHGLLCGQISASRLRQLEKLSALPVNAYCDPRLQSIVRQIELRAKVELAKLETKTAS